MQWPSSSAYYTTAFYYVYAVSAIKCKQLLISVSLPYPGYGILHLSEIASYFTKSNYFSFLKHYTHKLLLHIVKYFQGTNEEAYVLSHARMHTNNSASLLVFYALTLGKSLSLELFHKSLG